jgi:hypothetical protein
MHLCFLSIMYFLNHSISINVELHKECYFVIYSTPWFQKVVLRTNIMQFHGYLPSTYFPSFHDFFCSLHSLSLNNGFHLQWKELWTLSSLRKICANKQMISCYNLNVITNRFSLIQALSLV